MAETVAYRVPDVSCAHCVEAITQKVRRVPGVESVDVDLASKLVTIAGADLDETALQEAIEEAGYEVAP